MRPFIETIRPEPDASWAFLDRRLDGGIPFEWHQHPEYELTLTLNSRGHRYIGDDVDAYDDGDLVLIGPGVPHSWCSREALADGPHVALVIWFTSEWVKGLTTHFPELRDIEGVLARSSQGLRFSEAARVRVKPLIEQMRAAPPRRRLLLLLQVLEQLSLDHAAMALANVPRVHDVALAADARIVRVLNYLHTRFAERVSVDELAAIACLSTSAFHRMFRRHTRTTMVDYLTRLRLGRACSLLIGSAAPISAIASDVGYTNLSLFNRQFARLKGEAPSAFRRRHRVVLGGTEH